jgi:hypothetical protein
LKFSCFHGFQFSVSWFHRLLWSKIFPGKVYRLNYFRYKNTFMDKRSETHTKRGENEKYLSNFFHFSVKSYENLRLFELVGFRKVKTLFSRRLLWEKVIFWTVIWWWNWKKKMTKFKANFTKIILG